MKENILAHSFMRIIIEKLKMIPIAYSGLMTPAGRYYLEESLKTQMQRMQSAHLSKLKKSLMLMIAKLSR